MEDVGDVLRWLPMLFMLGCYATAEDADVSSFYGISGLNTAPNPQVAVPPGSLTTADNIVIRRAGMAEPRTGFKKGTATALSEIWKIVPFDGDYFSVGSTSGARWSNNTATDPTWTKHYIRAVEARKNLYMTTADATRKFTAALDTTADLAGLTAPPGGVTAFTTGTAIAAGSTVAYRFVIRRTDANGIIVRSSPSTRMILYNNSGVAKAASNTYYIGITLGYIAGDVMEVYRSVGGDTGDPSAIIATPPDELFLVHEVTLSATNITAGSVTDVDNVPDSRLGRPLYTNSSQEGIARANIPPPRARDLALYQGSVFAADIQYPQQLTERWVPGGGGFLDRSTFATGIGTRTYTGTRTNTSNQITGMSSVVGLKVGQMLEAASGSGWDGTLPVLITAIVGSTLTMSQTRTGGTDGAPASLTFTDTIRIKTGSEDQYYEVGSPAQLVNNLTTVTGARVAHSAVTTVYLFGESVVFGNTGPGTGIQVQAQFSQLLPTTGAFQMWATHGDEYDPVLPEPTVATGTSSTQDAFTNGLTWSKQEEPEHFMSGQLRLVGNAKSPILRIVALTDGIYILKGKGDGLYRLTGFGELSGWRVEQIDPSTYLLHAELATVLEDAIYGWTNTGMCRIDAGGQRMLSAPILNLTEDSENTLDWTGNSSHAFAFAAANLPDHEVIFGLPSSDTDGTAPAATYVYNTLTNAWTTWFGDATSPYTMVLNPKTNALLHGGASSTPSIGRVAADTAHAADAEFSFTISAVDTAGTAITITAGSGWTPAIGDMVKRGSTYAIVVSTSDATHFVSNVVLTTGSSTAFVAFYSTITWLPQLEPTGAYGKRFTDIVAHWDDTYGLYTWHVIMTASRNPSSGLTRNYTRTYDRSGQVRDDSRALTDRTVQLTNQLYIAMSINQADARWRLSGITVNSEVTSMTAAR